MTEGVAHVLSEKRSLATGGLIEASVAWQKEPARIEIPSLQSKTGSEIMHRKDYSESI